MHAQATGTVFSYFADQATITSTYKGDWIRIGNQVGRVTGTDTIEPFYQCVATEEKFSLAGRVARRAPTSARARRFTLVFLGGAGAMRGEESSYVELVDYLNKLYGGARNALLDHCTRS